MTKQRLWPHLLILAILLPLAIFAGFRIGEPPRCCEEPRFFSQGLSLRSGLACAIASSQESVVMVGYSLTDPALLHALWQKSKEGVRIAIVKDRKTSSKLKYHLEAPVELYIKKGKGLLHQKICIIDEQDVWVGSANFTDRSLLMHKNLVFSVRSKPLARKLLSHHPYLFNEEPQNERLIPLQDQTLEVWTLPEEGTPALNHLIKLIDQATHSLQIVLFTWTHPEIAEAVIEAHKRGCEVKVLLDASAARGAGRNVSLQLHQAGIDVRLGGGRGLVHEKTLLIDDTTVVFGSTNWTKAAFTKNDESLLVLHPLTFAQKKMLHKRWKDLRSQSRPFQP